MTGRRLGTCEDVRWDYWIHRYRHSANACKARRIDKMLARRKDRRKTKRIEKDID